MDIGCWQGDVTLIYVHGWQILDKLSEESRNEKEERRADEEAVGDSCKKEIQGQAASRAAKEGDRREGWRRPKPHQRQQAGPRRP